jgi:hypothetical protein
MSDDDLDFQPSDADIARQTIAALNDTEELLCRLRSLTGDPPVGNGANRVLDPIWVQVIRNRACRSWLARIATRDSATP